MRHNRRLGFALVGLVALLAASCKPPTPQAPEGWSRIAQDNLVLHAMTGLACPEKIGELARATFGNSDTAKENPFCEYVSGDGFQFKTNVLANRPTKFVDAAATVADYEAQIDRLSASLAPAQCPPTTKIHSTAEAVFNGWWVHLDIDAPCDRQDAGSRLIAFESDLRARLMKNLAMRAAPTPHGEWLIVGGVPKHTATGLACPVTLNGLGRIFYRELNDEALCHYRSNDDVVTKAFVLLPKDGARYDIQGEMQNYENAQNRLGRVPTVNKIAYNGGLLAWYADPETANALTGGRCPTQKRVYAGYVLKVRGWLVRLEFEMQCDASQSMSQRFTANEEAVHAQLSGSLKQR